MEIQPEKSTLTFNATQNDAPVEGAFKTFSGEINFDPQHLDQSNIHIMIDMNSLTTSYSDLTTTLNTADWFNIKLFPKAEFRSASITKVGDNRYQAKGNLTIRDKTQPVTLNFSEVESPKGTAKAEGDTTVSRLNLGRARGMVEYDEVKDNVKVHFTLTALQAP